MPILLSLDIFNKKYLPRFNLCFVFDTPLIHWKTKVFYETPSPLLIINDFQNPLCSGTTDER